MLDHRKGAASSSGSLSQIHIAVSDLAQYFIDLVDVSKQGCHFHFLFLQLFIIV